MPDPTFFEVYGPAVDKRGNAAAYKLTHGGRDMPPNLETLYRLVIAELTRFPELSNDDVITATHELPEWWDFMKGENDQ